MWPSCHLTGVGSWSTWNVAGALLGTLVPLLFLAVLVVLGIFLYRRLLASRPNQALAPSGREIARARYARGEITREQYNELLSDLSAGKDEQP